jgi:ATP-dependent helicase HrpA
LNQALPAAPKGLQRLTRAIEAQRERLVFPGFMSATPWEHLGQVPRYLKGLARRLQKYADNPERDVRHAAQLDEWWRRWDERMTRARRESQDTAALEAFRWWIEELAIALFAQELKTPFPVSTKRLEKRWSELAGD